MKVIWRSIDNFPNYVISNTGEVVRLSHKFRTKYLTLKPQISKFGYGRVNLYHDKK